MARSQVSIANPKFQTVASVTADAFDLTNDHYLDVSDVSDERLAIRFEGSTVEATATIKSGDWPQGTQGDLEVTIGATDIKTITLETARFKDNDGYILIDLASTGSADGTIEAYKLGQ